MATHSSILAWEIQWTEEPSGLQPLGSQRVEHNLVTNRQKMSLRVPWANDTEKAMAPHSSTLAWKIPCLEEPGGLQSMRSLRVGYDWGTSLSLFTFLHWRRKWQPTPVFLPGEPRGRGSLLGAVYGVAQSWTRLKRLSGSSSRADDKSP